MNNKTISRDTLKVVQKQFKALAQEILCKEVKDDLALPLERRSGYYPIISSNYIDIEDSLNAIALFKDEQCITKAALKGVREAYKDPLVKALGRDFDTLNSRLTDEGYANVLDHKIRSKLEEIKFNISACNDDINSEISRIKHVKYAVSRLESDNYEEETNTKFYTSEDGYAVRVVELVKNDFANKATPNAEEKVKREK